MLEVLHDAEINKEDCILGLSKAHKQVLQFDVMVNEVVGIDMFELGYQNSETETNLKCEMVNKMYHL